MRFFFCTLAVIGMLGFAVATVVEIIVSIGRIVTAHPFRATGSLILAAVFGVIAYVLYLGAKALLETEPAS